MTIIRKLWVFVTIAICLTIAPNVWATEKINTFEIGSETTYFSFKQPDLNIKDSGSLNGVYGTYTFKPQAKNLITSIFDVYKLDAHFSTGPGTYKTAGRKLYFTNYLVEPRVLIGKGFTVKTIKITPYTGFGYRYFHRDVGKTAGAGVVDDNYQYYYLPLGIDLAKEFKNGWKTGINVEYAPLLRGYYIAPFSDANDSTTTYTDIKNTLKSGRGFRMSISVEKNLGHIGFIIKPYMRTWRTGSSDTTLYYSNNSPNSHQETKATSYEVGISLGITF